jgi:hypothetical protein
VKSSGPNESWGKKIAFRAVAIILGLAIALIAAEVFLRVFQMKPRRYQPAKTLAWDGTTFRDLDDNSGGRLLVKTNSRFQNIGVEMGEYLPGATFKLVFPDNPRGYFGPGNAVLMTINSQGLRGDEVTQQKPAGTYRILGIGDSFAFGEGVKDEDTFLHRLQVRLNTNGSGPRYQVLNAGVQGYNTRDEVINLEYRWASFQPDLVIIVFYINDAYRDTTILNRGQELGIYDMPTGLAKCSYLWDIAQHRYRSYHAAKEVENFYQMQYFSDPKTFFDSPGTFRVDWPVCAASLERATQIAQKHKFRLGLVMFPELYKLKHGYPFERIHQLVGETCGRLNIPFLDLLDTFRGRGPESLWVHPSNHHPNEIAHALAETAIERFVRENYLSSSASEPVSSR